MALQAIFQPKICTSKKPVTFVSQVCHLTLSSNAVKNGLLATLRSVAFSYNHLVHLFKIALSRRARIALMGKKITEVHPENP